MAFSNLFLSEQFWQSKYAYCKHINQNNLNFVTYMVHNLIQRYWQLRLDHDIVWPNSFCILRTVPLFHKQWDNKYSLLSCGREHMGPVQYAQYLLNMMEPLAGKMSTKGSRALCLELLQLTKCVWLGLSLCWQWDFYLPAAQYENTFQICESFAIWW